MTALIKLKLVTAQAERKSPTILRRNKLTGKLDQQIAAAKSASNGETYVLQGRKFVQNSDTGVRTQVDYSKRVKQWWWSGSNNKILLSIRYGAKSIELAKGKNAIELNSMEELIAALTTVKEAVHAGELDVQIEQASGKLRAGFAPKK